MKKQFENSVNFIYNHNIEDIKDFNEFISPNTFVVSSYNYNIYHNFENYSGISYELYYVDNNKNIQQLTYNLIEGNGILLKDNKITINIDNQTLKSFYDKSSNSYYINVNIDNFKESSYLNKGLVKIDNDLYYNNNYIDKLLKNGSFKLNNNIELSSGLLSDLQLVKYYYNSCITKMGEIENLYKLCLIEIGQNVFIKTGDILYYNLKTKKFAFNKKDDNIPYMVCVIGSNILPDCQPRFIKLDRDNDKHVFDKSSSLYVKSSYNSVPIYTTNNLSYINISTNITNSSYGFIATDNVNWFDNYTNPLNKKEHYYANIPQMQQYELTYSEIVKPKEVAVVDRYYNLYWYCDKSKVNLNNYQIQPYGIYSDLLDNEILTKYKSQNLEFLFHIYFTNGATKKYRTTFVIENRRLISKETLYPYDSINAIINNYGTSVTSILDTLSQSKVERYNNINNTYISYYDTSRNINILSNVNATNMYNQYSTSNDYWYKEYNQGIIGTKITSNEEYRQYQYLINQSRINLKIDANLCNQDCYLKVSLMLKNSSTVHSNYFIKYNNSIGIHYLLADVSSNSINDNSIIKIECYQMGDYSGSPYKLPSINIINSSEKIYGYGGIILNCHIKSSIYGFTFNPIVETINISNVYKDYWVYNNNITNYLNLMNTASLISSSNINTSTVSVSGVSNYWIDFNKSNCSNNNNIYYKSSYKSIHIHPQGIVINLEKCYNNYNWKSYDTYYVDFDIYYLPNTGDISQNKIESYTKIQFNILGQKLVLKNIIFIPKNSSITKFVINNVYTSKNISLKSYINLSQQGEIKNYNTVKKFMNNTNNYNNIITSIASTANNYSTVYLNSGSYNKTTYEVSI